MNEEILKAPLDSKCQYSVAAMTSICKSWHDIKWRVLKIMNYRIRMSERDTLTISHPYAFAAPSFMFSSGFRPPISNNNEEIKISQK